MAWNEIDNCVLYSVNITIYPYYSSKYYSLLTNAPMKMGLNNSLNNVTSRVKCFCCIIYHEST